MRGLTQASLDHPSNAVFRLIPSQFIADIRGARVRELEEKRINKEMANIRKKFKGLFAPATSASSRFTGCSQTETSTVIRRRSKLRGVTVHATSNLNFCVSRYVAKIIFTYILGYKVDVGHMEAVNLIASSKYSEKQIVWSRAFQFLGWRFTHLDRDTSL